MSNNIIAVVAEDKLTESVIHKCISVFLPSYTVSRSEIKNGRGNVKKDLAPYMNLACSIPVVIVVDLDHDICAPNLLNLWNLQKVTSKFIFRVAVREIEAWVLADRKRVSAFLGCNSDDITSNPDNISDPKQVLLELARKYAKEELRRDLVPRNFSKYPRIGPAYNLQMCKFVQDKWRPHVARNKSNSLDRAIVALARLEQGQ